MKTKTVFYMSVYLFVSIWLSVCRQNMAATRYVSPAGNNANPGTLDRPYATPGYASKQILSGDTLLIGAGEYILSAFWDDMITPPAGTADDWVVIQGQQGATPVLKGANNLFSAFEISGCRYLQIKNLEITSHAGNPFREGISGTAMNNPIHHVRIENVHIHHIDQFGIDLRDVDHLQIINCNISYTGFGSIGGPGASVGGWQHVLIDSCELSYNGHYYQGGSGPSPYDRPDGFGIEPSTGPIEISNTVVQHNRGDGLDSKAGQTFIHECRVANNYADGIKLWGDSSRVENCLIYGIGDGDPTPSPWVLLTINCDAANSHFAITNVTMHDGSPRGHYAMTFQYDRPLLATEVILRNNIIHSNGSMVFASDGVNVSAANNLFYITGNPVQIHANGHDYPAAQIGLLGPGNLYGDAQFVQPAWGADGDYHLQNNSPAIDKGLTGAGLPQIDLDGRQRPLGQYSDIGAFEYLPPVVRLQITILLEGAFSDGSMTTVLNEKGVIPLASPYPDAPQTANEIFANVIDWIKVELLTAPDASAAIKRSFFLTSAGEIIEATDGSACLAFGLDPGAYYIAIAHRNHRSIKSASSVSCGPGCTEYNFTTDQGQYLAATSCKELSAGIWGMVSGDIDQDHAITLQDYRQWFLSASHGDSGYRCEDLNFDGEVTTADYVLWFDNQF